jgi:serine phosphatase RsbU (regulator of sigma subunit)
MKVVNGSDEDTVKIKAFIDLGNLYIYNLPDTALLYYEKALEISEQIESFRLQANSRRNIGMVRENQGMYDQAIEEYFAALAYYEKTGNKQGIASCYNDIAIIHYFQGSYEPCMEYLTRSFEIKKELGDTLGMANYYTNMSSLNDVQGNYQEALNFSQKAIDLFKELDDKEGIAVGYGNIGTIHYNLGNYRISLDNHLKSVEMHQEIKNKDGMAHSLSNVAGVYLIMADSVARTESQRRDYLNQAISYGHRSLNLTEELDALYVKNYVANTLMHAYRAIGNPEEALAYADIFISTRDSLFNEEKARAIEEMDTKYETEKKQQQIELQESQILARDATIKQQKTLRNSLLGGLGAFVVIAFLISYAYVQKRKDNKRIREQNIQISEANEELKQLNEEIHAQKEEIEAQRDHLFTQNEAITDSINYAQRIQAAMLPPESYIHELLNEVFILYKPKDIVSGDFYWFKQVNQYVIIAAADCTGHGVPGAFMSILGMSFLNEIVQRREITRANQVLDELRHQIKHSLRQHGHPDEPKDGIDMALCVIDEKTRVMQYAGAHNPLYMIKEINGKPALIEIKADRMPLGYYLGKDQPFTNHEIKLEIGDTFYLFSDGFVDQKGGMENRKFLSRNFKELLLGIYEISMYDQKEALDKKLMDWTGNNPQIDDILVVGVRI